MNESLWGKGVKSVFSVCSLYCRKNMYHAFVIIQFIDAVFEKMDGKLT